MADQIPALLFGACLVIGGSFALNWHMRMWRRHQRDAGQSAADRQYHRRQYSRRMQATGLIVLIGLLMPIGDIDSYWVHHQREWAYYWMFVLGLAVWVLVLGCADLLSTRNYSRDAVGRLQSLREKQRELEQEVARIRARSPNERPPGL